MAITAPLRRPAAFVIYKDEPQQGPPSKQPKAVPSATRNSSRIIPLSKSDKENLHPLTGRKPLNEVNSLKKPKTNALATKIIIATGKALVDATSPKKRKLVPPLEHTTVKKDKRDKRTTGSRKVHRPSRARNVIELARLDEIAEEEGDQDAEEHPLMKATETAANARCYELTVLPLADLSKAYEQLSSSELIAQRESSPDSEVCTTDYTPRLFAHCCDLLPSSRIPPSLQDLGSLPISRQKTWHPPPLLLDHMLHSSVLLNVNAFTPRSPSNRLLPRLEGLRPGKNLAWNASPR